MTHNGSGSDLSLWCQKIEMNRFSDGHTLRRSD
jgi:hypothetical protein